MTMREEHPDYIRLMALRELLEHLASTPATDLEAFEQLAENARGLTTHIDPQVARAAQQIELRACSVLLARQAAVMRHIGHRLKQLARHLPAQYLEQHLEWH